MGDDEVMSDSDWFYKRAVWQWCFAWLPHRCDRTKQLIWLRYAYRGTVYYENITGVIQPHAPMTHRWLTMEEYLIGALKGTV